ncbi:response regulator [Kordiimonas laminariae]|uniref:response regulator n=1 Tax=Kordiimonas laminariae TaxID=2917717 RepID=UPI001FF36BB7|nr:response regulator [Kordiimonas laminariae]
MNKGTVLLVDDELIVLQLQAAAVRHFGFEAIMADTAEEGLHLAGKHNPSLIISDVQMPGEGGFDFVNGLRRRGIKTMPVMYLTGYDDIITVRDGLKAGGDDFIIKGGPVENLRKRIAFWMTSGFVGLPDELRRRAIDAVSLDNCEGFSGIENYFAGDDFLVERATSQMREEVSSLPENYGFRMIERVFFMARLSHIVITQCSGFGDLVRFPEALDRITRMLDMPWSKDMSALYSEYEYWTQDIRFVKAGAEPLKPFQDYQWPNI